jgi:hypothetical protein
LFFDQWKWNMEWEEIDHNFPRSVKNYLKLSMVK